MQELDIITEERIKEEYSKLSDELKSKISIKDYELILEFEQHFNIIKSREDLDDETSMIHLTQTRMKIHHASSIRPINNELFTDESKFEMLSDIFKRKGKSIDLSILKQIVS
jgi:hypothetical protein